MPGFSGGSGSGPTKAGIQDSTYTYAADAEASDAYAITLSPAPAAYAAGQMFHFKANTANTTAASLNVNALGAKTIKKEHDQDLETGDIEVGSIVSVLYDGTNMQMLSQIAAALALDADVVHDTGNETVDGIKTFSSDPLIPDEAYGVGWNGVLEPPTKNAVYDKIETIGNAPTVKNAILQMIDIDSGVIAYKQITGNTTAKVFKVILPFGITVNNIAIRTGTTVSTAGTVKIAVFSEDGTTQHISVTSPSLAATSTLYNTAVSAVALSAGVYYVVLIPVGTCDVTLTNMNSMNGIDYTPSGKQVLRGTLTVTADTMPATIDPTAVSFSDTFGITFMRLDN